MAWQAKEGAAPADVSGAGFQQGGPVEQSGGWNPPIAPPSPLPPVPSYSTYPSYPNGPA